MALLEVNNLEVYYGVICALKGISFHVNEGEIVSLIGANGAGCILYTWVFLLSTQIFLFFEFFSKKQIICSYFSQFLPAYGHFLLR